MNGGFGLVQWTPARGYFDWAEKEELQAINMDSELERLRYELHNGLQFYVI